MKADRLDDLDRHEEAEAVREEMASLEEPVEDDDGISYIDDTIDEELAAAIDLAEAGTDSEEFELAPIPPEEREESSGPEGELAESPQSAPSAPSPESAPSAEFAESAASAPSPVSAPSPASTESAPSAARPDENSEEENQ